MFLTVIIFIIISDKYYVHNERKRAYLHGIGTDESL